MITSKLLSRFNIAAITFTLWFAISSANDEPPNANSDLTKPESSVEKPATANNSMPDISGEWDMGRKGRFARCTVSRVTDGTADFQAYMNKQPWVKLNWLVKVQQFQGTVIEKAGPFNGVIATFAITLDETGQTLNVKTTFEEITPELVETKKKELIKSTGLTQEDVDELFDMRWKRRNAFGQKLAGRTIQIVGNPKSNSETIDPQQKKSEDTKPKSNKSDSNHAKPASSVENPTTADNSIPDISGEWDMERKGRFARCTVTRVTDGTADFHVYMNTQPWLKFKWLPMVRQFQGTLIDENGPIDGEMATFTMILDKTGQRLTVKTAFEQITPELDEAKKKELIKNAGVTTEEIDELFDMQWMRRNAFGEKLDGKSIQIVGKPKSKDETNNLKQNESEAVGSDPGRSDSKSISNANADPAQKTTSSDDQLKSPSIPGGPTSPRGPRLPSISDLWSDSPAPAKVSGDEKRPQFDRVSSPELLVIETKDGLSAYSTLTGTWDRVVVGLPKDGQPRLKQSITSSNFCSVIVDDQLFGFSSKAGKWGKLTIPAEFVGKVKPEHGWNMISARIGDRTFVLSPVTGKWTSSDDDTSSSVSIVERTPLSDPQIRPRADFVDAEQKLRLAVETSESRRLVETIAKHELQAATIAERIRTQSKSSPSDQTVKPTIEDLRRDVEVSLSSAFELKLQLEKLRVKELHARLSRLEQQIGRRQAQQKQIIERRTNELIAGDETEWNSDPNSTTQDENLKTEPKRSRPQQAGKPGSGQKSAFFYGDKWDGENPHPTAVTTDENGVIVKSEPDQNSENLVPVPVSFPSGDELATNLVSAREETAAAQSEFLRQESLFKLNVTSAQDMASARRYDGPQKLDQEIR